MPSPIHIDRGGRSVVITCDECTYWSAVRTNITEARECAANHEKTMHPGSDTHGSARRMRKQYARQHAAKAPKMHTKPYAPEGR